MSQDICRIDAQLHACQPQSNFELFFGFILY